MWKYKNKKKLDKRVNWQDACAKGEVLVDTICNTFAGYLACKSE
jgi:hypothetical protein